MFLSVCVRVSSCAVLYGSFGYELKPGARRPAPGTRGRATFELDFTLSGFLCT